MQTPDSDRTSCLTFSQLGAVQKIRDVKTKPDVVSNNSDARFEIKIKFNLLDVVIKI